jgi:hypothetical protein
MDEAQMIDLDELERKRAAAEAFHSAVCSAVAHLNTCPEIARSTNGRTAHLILRQALIDYADAMEQKP